MTKNFKVLLDQYRNTPLSTGSRYRTYLRMVKNARSFNDWVIIYQYGDNSYQYLAEEQMRAKVLKGKTSQDVQKNILELFEIVTDENEQNEILKAFLSKYDSTDDVLFVMTLSPWLVTGFEGMYDMSLDEIDTVFSEKERHIQEMRYSSKFLNWMAKELSVLFSSFFWIMKFVCRKKSTKSGFFVNVIYFNCGKNRNLQMVDETLWLIHMYLLQSLILHL